MSRRLEVLEEDVRDHHNTFVDQLAGLNQAVGGRNLKDSLTDMRKTFQTISDMQANLSKISSVTLNFNTDQIKLMNRKEVGKEVGKKLDWLKE